MALNISESRSSDAPDARPAPAARARDRQQLVDELVAELTSWSPREFLAAFLRLRHGSLSLTHLNVLTLLEADGPMAMGRLAEALDVSVASVSGIVARMEARCLVERVHAAHDRRLVLVRQTAGGGDVFRQIAEHRRAALQRVLTFLSDEELAGFLAGHRALRAARAAVLHGDQQETAAR